MNEPSLPSAYFGQTILVRPETLFYRSSPISPPKRSDPAALAEQLTLTWNQVDEADAPAALAAWMVNLVRPEIGPTGTQMLQNLMEQHWTANGGFRELFEQVALHRRQQLETAAKLNT
jgi:hypothetical protein